MKVGYYVSDVGDLSDNKNLKRLSEIKAKEVTRQYTGEQMK